MANNTILTKEQASTFAFEILQGIVADRSGKAHAELWQVYWRGNLLIMESGKYQWHKRNHAKCALRNCAETLARNLHLPFECREQVIESIMNNIDVEYRRVV